MSKDKRVQLTRWKTRKENPEQPHQEVKQTMWRLGASWTSIFAWIIREDYNSELSWQEGIRIFDKMRKSDAQVFATLLCCELPIRSTKRFIDPAVDQNWIVSEDAKVVSSFVEDCLFEHMNITRDSLLVEILTMLPYWFSLFEKVWKEKDWMIILEKIWSRKQSTIKRWITEDWSPWVEQRLPPSDDDDSMDLFVSIPTEKILLFTFRQEGDNYEWVSVLRSAYKHRRYKEELYKFDAVKHERQSVGIPVIYPAEWATDEDLAIAEEISMNIRANEQSAIVMPGPKSSGRELELLDMKSSTNSDLRTSINHHNREISKNILAQFIELWNTESWSRALSEDQSDFFLLGLTAVANHICDVFNRYLIPELVDYNFEVESYPHLRFNKLWSVDYWTIAEALSKLAASSVIEPDDSLEVHIREMMDLPSKEKNSVRQTKQTPETPQRAERVEAKEQCWHWHDNNRWHFDEDYRKKSQMIDNQFIIKLQNEWSEMYADEKKKLKINDFEKQALRPLTFAERKVNFTALKGALDKYEAILQEKLDWITAEMKEDMLLQVKKAVDKNDIASVWKIRAKNVWKLSSALTEVQKEMFEFWKKTAAAEMSAKVPPTRKEVRGALRVQNDNIVKWAIADLETKTRTAVMTNVNNHAWSITWTNTAAAVSAASQAIDVTIAKVANNLKTLWLIGAVNMWRATIYERYPEKIYWFQYSAIMDERTTDYCASLDGRVVKPWSAEFYTYMPPKHHNCRSIRVEILIDEIFKPDFTWIPSSIKAPATIDTFKPLKSPILMKWSPAVSQLSVELKQRKEKLEELENSWLYQNRQKQHKERIETLEKAISKAFSEELRSEIKKRLEE